jgi:6-phosphogluconolactonase/glucosamine-6-phosphate isomerase/deaminase
MKNTSVIVALIAGVSLIVAAALVSSAIKESAHSFEKAVEAAASNRHFTVGLEGGGSPLRFALSSQPLK